jgi:hypothetical protein
VLYVQQLATLRDLFTSLELGSKGDEAVAELLGVLKQGNELYVFHEVQFSHLSLQFARISFALARTILAAILNLAKPIAGVFE